MKVRNAFGSSGVVAFLGLLIVAVCAGRAQAQARKVGGEWTGKYVCRQGVTGARLILSEDGSRGVFYFHPIPENPRIAEGCYQVTGIFNPASGCEAGGAGICQRPFQ